MAGAGYKLFNTGDVLTAAQVNTYLMEQTTMVFADAAARTAALSGVVSEGMISYLKSTKQVEVYNGSAWVASDDPNAIQNTIVDAKGDLIAATANDTPARLAVGNNGETLVADSSASTGLRWQGSIAAGKNVVINGGMDFWQRGTSFSNAHGYNADRWQATGATAVPVQTISRQTLTAGDLAGTGLQYFYRQNVTNVNGATVIVNQHRIEGVETFAGQTVTLSFYAKADSARSINAQISQNFGSGGSGDVGGSVTSFNLTTSWARYSMTVTMPSIAGKTIGTGNFVYISFGMPLSTFTIDFTGVQLELGSVATAFSRAAGTLAGEFAACQRYYVRFNGDNANTYFGWGQAFNSTTFVAAVPLPVTMRTASLTLDYSGGFVYAGNTNYTVTSMVMNQKTGRQIAGIDAVVASGLTANGTYTLTASSTSSYVGLSAEL